MKIEVLCKGYIGALPLYTPLLLLLNHNIVDVDVADIPVFKIIKVKIYCFKASPFELTCQIVICISYIRIYSIKICKLIFTNVVNKIQ